MQHVTRHHRIAIIMWSLLAGELLFVVLLGNVRVPPRLIGLVIALVLLLFGLAVISGIGLALCYHRAWHTLAPWLLTGSTLVVASVGSQLRFEIGPLNTQAAASLLFISGGAAFITGMCIWLYSHDVSLAIIAWLSLITVWIPIVWWRVRGDFLVEIIATLSNSRTMSLPVFWLAVVFSASWCLVPLCLLSFAIYSFRLVRREVQRVPLLPSTETSGSPAKSTEGI